MEYFCDILNDNNTWSISVTSCTIIYGVLSVYFCDILHNNTWSICVTSCTIIYGVLLVYFCDILHNNTCGIVCDILLM